MSTDTKDEQISVTEEQDGSVVVELPESELPPDPQEGAQSGPGDDGTDEDRPGDSDAVREARRARRRTKKDLVRRTNEEKDQRLQMLQRQNQELMERLSVVERKTHSSDLARLDKAIEDETLRFRYFTQKMQEATASGDGKAFTDAQEAWYETRRKIEAMNGLKQRAAQATQQQQGAANPKVTRLANDWMNRNDWYDPAANDEDTAIAKVIDGKLAQEGWDPGSSEYWDELDRRLQKRLPHRYTDSVDDHSRRSRPRSVVTGSGREVGGGSSRQTFVLSPEQVRAMKDAGMWDDPQSRARMIKRYAQEARSRSN
jgi:hypothetical protein